MKECKAKIYLLVGKVDIKEVLGILQVINSKYKVKVRAVRRTGLTNTSENVELQKLWIQIALNQEKKKGSSSKAVLSPVGVERRAYEWKD